MKKLIVFVILISASGPVHADLFEDVRKFGEWVGDRTGLRRPLEELSGEAERRRTEESRREAERAEGEKQKALAQAEQERINLEKAESEYKAFTAQVANEKAGLRKMVTPINARLFSLNATAEVMFKSHKDLLGDSSRVGQQLQQLSGALAGVVQPGSAGLMSEEDRALLRVLQIALSGSLSASAQYKEYLTNSMNMVSYAGRNNEKKLRSDFTRIQSAVVESKSVIGQTQVLNEELNRLTAEVQATRDNLKAIAGKSRDLDARIKQ